MIVLITATPGSGKTLYVLKHLREVAERENRQVFYSGIPLTEEGKRVLDWRELENPEQWYDMLPGSIVLIDECQRIFPVRRAGNGVPRHVSEFETHRHRGIDVYLITQHPNLLDSHVRRLVGRHVHLNRLFGAQAANVYTWEGLKDNPTSATARRECLDVRKFMYPREVYKWYKSSELHTHKVAIPRKVWLLGGLLLALPLLVGLVLFFLHRLGGDSDKSVKTDAQVVSASNGSPSVMPVGVAEKPPMTPQQWRERMIPRIDTHPESAPMYDELAKPLDFPRLSACIQSRRDCRCYTQQGNQILAITPGRCRLLIAEGWFDPYTPPMPLSVSRDDSVRPSPRSDLPAQSPGQLRSLQTTRPGVDLRH